MKRWPLVILLLGGGIAYPMVGVSADKNDQEKAKETAPDHVLIEKDCPEELEFKKKLAAGVRESNLAIYPLAAVAVVEEAAILADSYWGKRWNTFVDGARARANEAGVLKVVDARQEGFDTRGSLGKLCEAVASRNVDLCKTPTAEQRGRCLLQVALYSDCSVAGPYVPVCKVITNAQAGSCEELGGAEETCRNLKQVKQSLSRWCGSEGARTPTPECLGAMAVLARIEGGETCKRRPGLENLGPICDAMVSGSVKGCGTGLSNLEAGEPMPVQGTKLPTLKTHLEAALVSGAAGERSLLLWAGASRKAVCHVKATIADSKGKELATVEDVIRVLDNRTTDTQVLVPLRGAIDIFSAQVSVESQCTARYWW